MLKMKTPWNCNEIRFNFHFVWYTTNEANAWRCEDPAELPPAHWVVADHVLDSIVESLDSVAPRDRDALEEDQEEKTEPTDGVRVEDLERVHPALGDASYADEVADDADDADEHFLAATEKLRPLVDHRSDEALHRTELRVKADEKQHEEEQTRPKGRTRKLQNSRRIRQEGETGT